MKIEYSPAVQLALNKATALALRASSVEVSPMELLRGLMDDEECHPVVLARAAGVALEDLRRLLPTCDTANAKTAELPLADGAAAALARAGELTRLYGTEGSVSSDKLLLALLEVDVSSRSLLEGIGLDFAALKDRVAPPAAPLGPAEPLDLAPACEEIDTARILDASANRAREALRVLEDYARFVQGDSLVSARLKNLRHQLAAALEQLPLYLLLQARDTLHDVGTNITTEQEQERASPSAVVRANAKRLQEALRTLEEYGKVLNPSFARVIERLRYESYTMERALSRGGDLSARLVLAKLYVLVTEASCRASLVGTVGEALVGGAQVIQLREKQLDDRTLLATARDVGKMARSAGALFIVNDRPDIALLANADGVHLGQDDMPIHEARRILGPDALIGVSTHNIEQVREAVLAGANYLGVGPTFPSHSKAFDDFPGLEFVKQTAAETTLPFFVLGGVTQVNLQEILAAGGRRVAVSHAVCMAEDPRAVAQALRKMLEAT
jgi:thiamine-phosphate pyrophosphorylase